MNCEKEELFQGGKSNTKAVDFWENIASWGRSGTFKRASGAHQRRKRKKAIAAGENHQKY